MFFFLLHIPCPSAVSAATSALVQSSVSVVSFVILSLFRGTFSRGSGSVLIYCPLVSGFSLRFRVLSLGAPIVVTYVGGVLFRYTQAVSRSQWGVRFLVLSVGAGNARIM